MVNKNIINNQVVRVTDILLQVQKLNEMIDFHTKYSIDDGMKIQYITMRQQFIIELNTLLDNFQIAANLKNKAA